MTLLDKIIDIACERMALAPPLHPPDPNSELFICGYSMDDIMDSPELQRKVYALLTGGRVTRRITPASLRTLAVSDIRSVRVDAKGAVCDGQDRTGINRTVT